MADWIGFTMALLGAVLVLAGSTLIFLHARGRSGAYATEADTVPVEQSFAKRVFGAVRTLPEADRLIVWGLVLLFLGALAAGAIRFGFAFELGTFNTNVTR